MKERIAPSKEMRMRRPPSNKTEATDNIPTRHMRYVNFINDILSNVRKGGMDYAFYIYQIEDLLRYEPWIKTRYVQDGDFTYFEVWR